MMHLQRSLNDYFQGFDTKLYSRGSAGLLAFFRAVKAIHGSGEVIIPSICCETVAMAAMYAGLETVFCDVSQKTLCATEPTIEACINEKTLAIIAVHAFGNFCAVGNLVMKYPKIYFIEDIAQAVGGIQAGKNIGSTLDCTLLSFSQGKIIKGSGGALVFRNEKCKAIYDWIENNHCIRPMPEKEYSQKELSLRNISHSVYDLIRSENREVAPDYYRDAIKYYYHLLEDRGFSMEENSVIASLKSLPFIRNLRYENYKKYVDGIKNKSISVILYQEGLMIWRMSLIMPSAEATLRLSKKIRENNISASNHYFPLSMTLGCRGNENDKVAAERIINLWVDESVTNENIDNAISIINAFTVED